MLTAKQKSYLRSRANSLVPAVYVGKGGVTDAVEASLEKALAARELVKVRVQKNCDSPAGEVISRLAAATASNVVQQLGQTGTLYRPSSEGPKLSLPGGDA